MGENTQQGIDENKNCTLPDSNTAEDQATQKYVQPEKPSGPQYIIRCISGVSRGTEMPVTSDPIIIGRAAESSNLVIAAPDVSRRHASVSLLVDGTAVIEDINSSNGTFILAGGQKEQIHGVRKLKPGDKFLIGAKQNIFEFVDKNAAPQKPAQQNAVPRNAVRPPVQPPRKYAAPMPRAEQPADSGTHVHVTMAAPKPTKGNALGIISLIFGIISIFIFSLFIAPLSIIFGVASLLRHEDSIVWAVCGFITSAIGLATSPIFWAMFA